MLSYKVADTICAIATPSGHGGISVVRICGPRTLEVSRKLMNLPVDIESHRAYLTIVNSADQTKQIDEALVTYFGQGKSYTNDETLEISCHGSPVIAEEIIQNLILAGCRLAQKGEFTFRAFMSGRIDLLQAESILTLIQSDTKKAAEISLRQLKGELSDKVKEMQDKMTWLLAHLEASIDFSLEDLQTVDYETIKTKVEEIYALNKKLLDTYKKGKVITDSMNVALVGEPNAGKSSLFNQLIKNDKAIVTEIAGTTRDILEGYVIIGGVKVKFIDTAGLHDTKDTVEIIGIQKTRDQLKVVDHIFYVVDATQDKPILDTEILEKYSEKIIFLLNKKDLPKFKENFTHVIGKKVDNQVFLVSAKIPETLDEVVLYLENKIKQAFHESSAVVLKTRQFELLEKMNQCLERAKNLSSENASSEFTAFELRDALECCFDLLGERLDDQVMNKVFQEFCIGK
ncbi:MAG: tRNA uridine-5-carboxymethylaminomethyl(34) synthesis GTPase MnmE [Bdellovibrionota bacterium]